MSCVDRRSYVGVIIAGDGPGNSGSVGAIVSDHDICHVVVFNNCLLNNACTLRKHVVGFKIIYILI